ncbi:MAG TPA: ABC transporter ATP-binding protein [Chroococcidiopsis sp.]
MVLEQPAHPVKGRSPVPSSWNNAIAIATHGIDMVFTSQSERLQVLRGIDLSVQQGDVHVLMGPAGAGKTTLLLVLSGLLTPTAGEVCLFGQSILQMPRCQREAFRLRHIGFVDQEFNLFSALSALENVSVPLTLKGMGEQRARREARDLLAQVGLGDKCDNLPRELSGGQQQRVAIARAIAGYPDLIMADEPTAALDSQSGHLVMTLLRTVTRERGCTVVLTTHDHRTLELADQVSYLEDGMLVGSERSAELGQSR